MKAWPVLLIIAGCSSGFSPASREDRAPQETGSRFDTTSSGMTTQQPAEVHIHLESFGRVAAYQIVIRWDPTVARIVSIERCRAKEFPATPQFESRRFSEGVITVFADMPGGYGAGEYHLLTVRFERLKAGATPIEARLEALYDDADPPQRTRGSLTVEPSVLRFD